MPSQDHILCGLGGAQQQAAAVGGVMVGIYMLGVGAARVQVPAQLQRQHTLLARTQPQLQLRQQAPRTKQQGRGRLYAGDEFQWHVKHLGHGEPGVGLGGVAVGAV